MLSLSLRLCLGIVLGEGIQMRLNSCEEHDDCVVVFQNRYGGSCPICKLQEELTQLQDSAKELEA